MLQSVILAGITGRTITTVGTVIEIGTVIAIEVVATAVSICGCPFFKDDIGIGWHVAHVISFLSY